MCKHTLTDEGRINGSMNLIVLAHLFFLKVTELQCLCKSLQKIIKLLYEFLIMVAHKVNKKM